MFTGGQVLDKSSKIRHRRQETVTECTSTSWWRPMPRCIRLISLAPLCSMVWDPMGIPGVYLGIPCSFCDPCIFFQFLEKNMHSTLACLQDVVLRCSEMFFDFAILEDLEVSGFFWATLAQVIPDLTYLTDLKRSCLNLSNGGWWAGRSKEVDPEEMALIRFTCAGKVASKYPKVHQAKSPKNLGACFQIALKCRISESECNPARQNLESLRVTRVSLEMFRTTQANWANHDFQWLS